MGGVRLNKYTHIHLRRFIGVAITGGVLLIGMQYLCSLTTWRANRCEAEERYAPVELRFIQRIKWKEEVTGSSLRFFVEI
jgi:hypothetical protein